MLGWHWRQINTSTVLPQNQLNLLPFSEDHLIKGAEELQITDF
jgi:hypothetical protein